MSVPIDIPMAQPVIGEAEEREVLEVLRSGQLSLGRKTIAFEEGLAARVGVRFGRATSSGTAGLHLALRAAGVGEGDEVVTSPMSFIASANSVLFERAIPRFVDIDPVTFNLDVDAAADAITPKTKALLPVHIFGYPADTPALERHGLPIVEDACEALGATHADGSAVGGRGHSAVFAFYANKQLATGEGGMVVTNDAAVAERIGSERNQGRAPDMGWLDHDRLGFNYRMSELQAALGVAQLGRLDQMLADRAKVAGWYREALADLAARTGLTLPCEDRGQERRGWFVFVVQVPRGVDRDETIRGLRAGGIDGKPYLPPIHLFSFYRELGYREGMFPVCEDIGARSLALPFFPAMTQSQVERVVQRLSELVLGVAHS
ncbi:MAG: DegT/DnrJ/EryC1/StrS family aminotransferase [Solirubrobacteraceae bacterium]|nr:DegT/DnrJ/EryC1/StrS family aminotransferase [Solirubrobacteraceae bacterium]